MISTLIPLVLIRMMIPKIGDQIILSLTDLEISEMLGSTEESKKHFNVTKRMSLLVIFLFGTMLYLLGCLMFDFTGFLVSLIK